MRPHELPPPDPDERQWHAGDRSALDRWIPLLYEELRCIAHRELARERPDHTLRTTALVHEAYAKLASQRASGAEAGVPVLAAAARAMRTILVDHARARGTLKRGGGTRALPLDGVSLPVTDPGVESLIELDQALTRLGEIDDEASRIVEQRCFAGLTVDESARALGLSPATARRRWAFAKAWLHRELAER
jgi:RNA polymerase sigma factor (TIGR02999 family)